MIGWSVGHRDAGAVHQFDFVSVPERPMRNISLHSIDQMGVNFSDRFQQDSSAGLGIGGSAGAHLAGRFIRGFADAGSHDLACSLPAGAPRR